MLPNFFLSFAIILGSDNKGISIKEINITSFILR